MDPRDAQALPELNSVARGFCGDCGTPLTLRAAVGSSIALAICALDEPNALPPQRCGPYCSCQRANIGISTWHGAHQVAQKFSSTTLPCSRARSRLWPVRSRLTNSGALRPTSDCVPLVCAPACGTRGRSRNVNPQRSARMLVPLKRLMRNRIPFVNPVVPEVIRDVENFHIRKAKVA